jgi:tripeptide aminopeptidase
LTPETTDGRQGFIHCYAMSGTRRRPNSFILRDFEMEELQRQGELVEQVCACHSG